MKIATAKKLLDTIIDKLGKDKVLGIINSTENPEITIYAKEQQMDDFIKGLCAKLTIKTSADYPISTFYMDGDTLMIKHDTKNNYAWLSYKNIWSVFEDKFGLNYNDIQSVTKSLLEKRLKLKGVTTYQEEMRLDWPLEKHLKLKGVTTIVRSEWDKMQLEKHLKLKGVTA